MPIHIILPPVFDVGPNLSKALHQIGAAIVADATALDDLSTALQARLDDLKSSGDQTAGVIVAALQAKHDQVMATIAKLQADIQAGLGQATDPAAFQRFKDTMGASFDVAKSNLQAKQDQIVAAIQGVDQPDAVPPPPDVVPPAPDTTTPPAV